MVKSVRLVLSFISFSFGALSELFPSYAFLWSFSGGGSFLCSLSARFIVLSLFVGLFHCSFFARLFPCGFRAVSVVMCDTLKTPTPCVKLWCTVCVSPPLLLCIFCVGFSAISVQALGPKLGSVFRSVFGACRGSVFLSVSLSVLSRFDLCCCLLDKEKALFLSASLSSFAFVYSVAALRASITQYGVVAKRADPYRLVAAARIRIDLSRSRAEDPFSLYAPWSVLGPPGKPYRWCRPCSLPMG